MNTATIYSIGHNSANSPIDRAGAIRAQIAKLEAELKPLEADIKGMGVGSHAGDLFDANVADVAESTSFDGAAMEEKLRDMGVDNRFFKNIVKVRAGYLRLTVKARR